MLWPLGALWERVDREGTPYLTGHIECNLEETTRNLLLNSIGGNTRLFLKVFPNNRKREGDNKPEHIMYANEN